MQASHEHVSLIVGEVATVGVGWLNFSNRPGRVFLGQTLIKIEHYKVKWVLKFVQQWNIDSLPFQLGE